MVEIQTFYHIQNLNGRVRDGLQSTTGIHRSRCGFFLYACHFWVDFVVSWYLLIRFGFGLSMAAIPMITSQRRLALGYFYLMGIKIFSNIFAFGLTAFDVFLFSLVFLIFVDFTYVVLG